TALRRRTLHACCPRTGLFGTTSALLMGFYFAMRTTPGKAHSQSVVSGRLNISHWVAEAPKTVATCSAHCSSIVMTWDYTEKKSTLIPAMLWEIFHRLLPMSASLVRRFRCFNALQASSSSHTGQKVLQTE